MDVELFGQMIRNEAFDSNDLYKLISYTFQKCIQLGSPQRDAETNERLRKVLELMYSKDATIANIVPYYILHINHCVDMIHMDVSNFIDFLETTTES